MVEEQTSVTGPWPCVNQGGFAYNRKHGLGCHLQPSSGIIGPNEGSCEIVCNKTKK